MMSEKKPEISDRLDGLLWGCFAGDALALGVHWIYDADDIRKEVDDLESYIDPVGKALEYHPGKNAGDFTHYGDQTLCLMSSLSEDGGWNPEAFVKRWRGIFEEDSAPYTDHATKETLRNMKNGLWSTRAGSTSAEMGGAARFAPAMALLADRPLEERIKVAREQTELTHRGAGTAECAEFLCRSLDALLHGAELSDALDHAASAEYRELDLKRLLFQARLKADVPVEEAVHDLGPGCGLPGALKSAMRIALEFPEDPRGGLIVNVMAGGDSGSRGLVIGTWLGAAAGVDALPEEWIKGLRARREIEDAL